MRFIDPSLVNENILAVDIGQNGGFCVNFSEELDISSMQEDLLDQWEFIKSYPLDKIIAENIHTFPASGKNARGVVSSGSLVKRRGHLEAFAAIRGVEVEWIEPTKWMECFTLKRKKHYRDSRTWKQHLLDIAKKLAPPDIALTLTLKTADAFLLWNWAASRLTDKPLKLLGTV